VEARRSIAARLPYAGKVGTFVARVDRLTSLKGGAQGCLTSRRSTISNVGGPVNRSAWVYEDTGPPVESKAVRSSSLVNAANAPWVV
jgi:hypothetical protein